MGGHVETRNLTAVDQSLQVFGERLAVAQNSLQCGAAEDEEMADIDGTKLVPQPAVEIPRACRCRAEVAKIGLPDGRPAGGDEAKRRKRHDQEQRAQMRKLSGTVLDLIPDAGGLSFGQRRQDMGQKDTGDQRRGRQADDGESPEL